MSALSAKASGPIGVSGHPLTSEQEEILSHPPDSSKKWEAFAGCAKTSTSIEFAHAWPRPAIYIAFNNSIVAEAESKFPSHVQTRTANSYAYNALGINRYRDRLIKQRLRPDHLDPCSDLLRPIGGMTDINVRRAIIKTMGNFLISADDEVSETHIAGVPYQAKGAVLPLFSAVIERIMDYQHSGLVFTHDVYLKAFARHSVISDQFDYLIVDEFQDLNPVLIDIVNKSRLPAMIVGDPWQSIYAFRGAVSAMQSFRVPALSLTKSFRFGPAIAALANRVLSNSLNRPEKQIVGNPAKQSVVMEYKGTLSRRCTILARTNFRIFESLVTCKLPFHMIGGIDEMINQVAAGYSLYKGNRATVIDPMVSRFYTWDQCKEAAEHEDDPELARLVRIIEQYTDSVPEILAGMKKLHVPDEREASIVVATAHKAKGREWTHVVVLDDFLSISELRAMLSRKRITAGEYNQEINLIYVTLTRAIETLAISQPLFEEVADGRGFH